MLRWKSLDRFFRFLMKKYLFCLVASIVVSSTLFAEVPPAPKLLPADTLCVLTIPDFAHTREIYQQSPQGRLWRDPAMKAFVDKFTAKLNEEFTEPLEKDLSISLTNYMEMLQGQLTFALIQNGWDGGETSPQPGWVILLDAKDKSGLLRTNLNELKSKWTATGKLSRTEKVRDVEFTVLKLSTNDLPPTLQKLFPNGQPTFAGEAEKIEDAKPAPTEELLLGQSDSLLIIGNQTNALEKILIAQSGADIPRLADLPAFVSSQEGLFHDAFGYGWINAKTIIDIINQQLAQKAEEQSDKPSFLPFRPEKLISTLGLDAIKTIAFSACYTDDGSYGELFIAAPESERHALLSLIAGANKEVLPPEFVPADAVKFQRIRLDGLKTWANLEKTLGSLSPQLLAGLNFVFEMAGGMAKEKNPEYNLKKSLIDSLGDDIITFQKAPRSSDVADLVTPPAITLIGSTQPDQFLEAVKYLITTSNQRGQPAKEREFLGHKIYYVDLPPIQLPEGKVGPERTLNFCAAKGYVALSSDPALLEEFIRAGGMPAKPLRESIALLDAVVRLKGSRPTAFSYENQAETMRSFLTGLKQNFGNASKPITPLGSLGMLNREKLFREWADVSLLPDFDQIAKYFHITVSVGSASVQGLSIKMFSPVPPQLKHAAEEPTSASK